MDYKKAEAERKQLISLLKEVGVMKQITLKNIKTEIGHDMGGYYFDFYLKGHGKIGCVNDDGWGGHVEPTYVSDEKQKVFENLLKKHNVRQLMFDNGWGFFKEGVKTIDINTQALSVLELKLGLINDEKFEKKRTKTTVKGIVYGTENRYSSRSYKYPLRAIAASKGGLPLIQKLYDEVKSNLKKGEKIFNTNLEELGIKL